MLRKILGVRRETTSEAWQSWLCVWEVKLGCRIGAVSRGEVPYPLHLCPRITLKPPFPHLAGFLLEGMQPRSKCGCRVSSDVRAGP